MAAELLKLKGKGKWIKVFESNRDMREDFHGKGGAYTLQLYLDQEYLDEYTAAGGRIKPKTDEEGVFLTFKRKHIHDTITAFGGPPQVVNAEEEEWTSGIIGNGSELEVAVTVYDTRMGKGTRLEGVKVLVLEELPEMEDSAPVLPFG